MQKFGLIGVSALSLVLALAVPASAHKERHHTGRVAYPPLIVAGEPNLPIENALRWGYSQGYSYYPSGFGGLYGDGRYPDNTVSNPRTYNTLH